MRRSSISYISLLSMCFLFFIVPAAIAADPIPSWNSGPAKQKIVDFVTAVTTEKKPDFVPPTERIAVFDNDGTLWAEQPLYFQFVFMLVQLKAAAATHPEWKENAAFKALMAGNHAEAARHQQELLQLLAEANSGMTAGEYDRAIRDWITTARHPKFERAYTELIYQPQVELLQYLRDNEFKIFIVSGGSIDFMRPWVEKAYGIPPEQVIGSSQLIRFELREGKPTLVRDAKMDFVDDGPGKPVGIYRNIGRWPILAFGNSDGDLQMLQTVAARPGRSLVLIVHHDDAEREFAYDRKSHIGMLDKAWDEAIAKGWTVVSIKRDWKRVFPFQE